MIRRTEHSAEKRYAIISRRLAQDSNLSFEARGILLYILSKPSNWKARDMDLQKEGKLGEKRIAAALRELKTHGYFRRERVRGKKGRFTYENEVLEEPEDALDRTPYTEDGTALPLPPHGGGSTVLIDKDVCARADLSKEKEDTEKEITPPVFNPKRSERIAAQATSYAKPEPETAPLPSDPLAGAPRIIRIVATFGDGWIPPREQWDAVERATAPFELDIPMLWTCWYNWRINGWREENLKWILECYVGGSPPTLKSFTMPEGEQDKFYRAGMKLYRTAPGLADWLFDRNCVSEEWCARQIGNWMRAHKWQRQELSTEQRASLSRFILDTDDVLAGELGYEGGQTAEYQKVTELRVERERRIKVAAGELQPGDPWPPPLPVSIAPAPTLTDEEKKAYRDARALEREEILRESEARRAQA